MPKSGGLAMDEFLHPTVFHGRNRPVSQIRVLLAACGEIAVDYNTLLKVLYIFEHKT